MGIKVYTPNATPPGKKLLSRDYEPPIKGQVGIQRVSSWELKYPLPAGTFESMIFLLLRWDTLPETNNHLKIGRAPKGKDRIPNHPFSGANLLFFRECM